MLSSSSSTLTFSQNIAKAQAEIDRLEAEAEEAPTPAPSSSKTSNRKTHDTAKKPAIANQSINGDASAVAELAQEKDAEADVSQDLKNASLEDKADE